MLYLIAFIALVLIAAATIFKLSNALNDDKWLVRAVLIALPLLLVRIAYSILSAFAHSRHFNLITGSVVILVVMATLEEMAVVFIYLLVGWKIDTLTPLVNGPVASRPWKGRLDAGAGGRGGNGRGRRQGPIHALVGAGIAAAQHHKEAHKEAGEV